MTIWIPLHCFALYFASGDNVPSANSYTLPTLLGSKVPNKISSASYSMAARAYTGSFAEDLAKTPGPGRYNAVIANTYTNKAPAYSMLGRSYMPGGILHPQLTIRQSSKAFIEDEFSVHALLPRGVD